MAHTSEERTISRFGNGRRLEFRQRLSSRGQSPSWEREGQRALWKFLHSEIKHLLNEQLLGYALDVIENFFHSPLSIRSVQNHVSTALTSVKISHTERE
jgi:hypothetical protein